MNKISYNELDIEVVYNPKLKNTYISVHSDKKVLIKSSIRSDKYILEILRKREGWIHKQINNIQNAAFLEMNLEDEVLIFGEKYSIDSFEATDLREKLQNIVIDKKDKVAKCYDEFYKQFAKKYISSRVKHFSEIMNLQYHSVVYKKMRSRWGSCSSKQVITFNTQLMKVQKELIDYVVVHELAHLVHMNHSGEFHALVDKYLKNSKQIRKKLKNFRLLS